MKITYRREMKHNYMIIDPESLVWRNYECRMLAANTVEGVLRFQIRQIDDEIRFYYEITSRQPLTRMLEGRSIRSEELRRLVLGISAVLDKMEQYLLREGIVLLEAEHIYVEPESFRIWLCLVPGLNRDFPEDYGKLLEYLLGKVDHQDKDSVILAYGLYQETRKENYGMEDILRLLCPEQEKAGGREADEVREPSGIWEADGARGKTEVWEPKGSRETRNAGEWDGVQETFPEKPKKHSLWSRISGWWAGRGEKKQSRGRKREELPVQVPWEMMFQEEAQPQAIAPSSTFTGAKAVAMPQATAMPRATAMSPVSVLPSATPGQDTVLLADLSQEPVSRLRRLRSLDGETEDIAIAYYPFIIGKQENLVDYLLEKETVSRLHLRIDREGDRYLAQDLNSTNGTTVNGALLDNNETVELQDGMEIRIAKYRFRFE